MRIHNHYHVLKAVLLGMIVLLGLILGYLLYRDMHTPSPARQSRKATQQQSPQHFKKPPIELPGGGRELFRNRRLVALYGSPGAPVLGMLGEQSPEAAVARVRSLAAEYQAHTDDTILPTFEIIATVASASPTANGDYSRELDIATIQPWIDAAKQANIYVVLDLQPGRVDFLTQAKLYEPLLREPHVGLALDPEWRLTPDQFHMKQIGSVSAAEINQVSTWLAELARTHALPQKLLLLHQFRHTMITNRDQLDLSHKELAVTIQMDGNGAQSTKQGTWNTLRAQAPPELRFGWKNFYDEDKPMLSPVQTLQVSPTPWYISYQ